MEEKQGVMADFLNHVVVEHLLKDATLGYVRVGRNLKEVPILSEEAIQILERLAQKLPPSTPRPTPPPPNPGGAGSAARGEREPPQKPPLFARQSTLRTPFSHKRRPQPLKDQGPGRPPRP
ncbi:hypothetical protein TthTF19_24080 (plasmid) [Thermus thermophilus]